ncbi:MAG: hypothetical protein RSE50_14635, partial [Myroides sp.]
TVLGALVGAGVGAGVSSAMNEKTINFRKNRNSVAVLNGNESKEDMLALGEDIFRYYGLGCRNVSKLFVPKDYNFDDFFGGLFQFKDVLDD